MNKFTVWFKDGTFSEVEARDVEIDHVGRLCFYSGCFPLFKRFVACFKKWESFEASQRMNGSSIFQPGTVATMPSNDEISRIVDEMAAMAGNDA